MTDENREPGAAADPERGAAPGDAPDAEAPGSGTVSEPGEGATSRALDAALNYLSYRQRTEEEVRRKLAERGYGQATIEQAVDRLRAVGLVDDESFVAAYVRDRIAHRPMGMRRMAQELYVKGIPRDISEPMIASVFEDEGVDERGLARRMAERRARTRAKSRDSAPTFRRRLRHALMRRGFDRRLAREVVEEVLPGLPGDGECEAEGRGVDGS